MIRPLASSGPSNVGAAIRQARLARGWSQDVLARRIVEARRSGGESVDPLSVKTQLSRWENGRVVPDRCTRQVLADVFSTTAEGTRSRMTPILPTQVTTDPEVVDARLAVLPIGSFEQHGPHLPLVTDTLVAVAIADRISDRYGALRLPR